jgi:TPR repeat protein
MRKAMLFILGAIGIALSLMDPVAAAGPVERPALPPVRGKAVGIVELAERGNARAQAQLAFMYQTGRGMPQHYVGAVYWYRRAAEQGYGHAQFMLGLMYDKGQGVPQDGVEAYKWVNLAASRATGKDREYKLRIRDAIGNKMSFANLYLAQQLAIEWYPKRER